MFVQCCFTFTETTLRTIRRGEPRTATSTFTQLLNSDRGGAYIYIFFLSRFFSLSLFFFFFLRAHISDTVLNRTDFWGDN